MTVQHKDIPNAQLHEPKNVSTAAIETVYRANGSGSGTWQKLTSNMFKGLAGDGGIADKKVLTDGTGGFKIITDVAYGSATITNNAVNFPVVAVADTTFNTPSQYSLLTGVGAPWLSENLFGITFSVDRLTVPVTGVYMINLWMNVNTFPNSTAKVSIRYKVNGTTYSSRKPTIKSAVANDVSQLTGFGLIPLTAGDYIQLFIASDTTGNILVGDANNSLHLVRQTA